MSDKYLTWPNLHLIASCISLSSLQCVFSVAQPVTLLNNVTCTVTLFRWNPTGWITCIFLLVYFIYCIFPCGSCAGGMGTYATTILTKNVVFPLGLWEDDEWDLQKKGTWTQLQEIWNTGQQPESNMITDAYIWHMIDRIGLPLLARTPNALWSLAFNTHE